MRSLRSLIGSVNAPRASRWLLATATVLLTAWLQAHILLAAVHDDGSTARHAIAVYNSGDVRDQVSGVVDWALQTGGELSGSGAALAPAQAAIATVLDSGQISAPVADALVGALILLRDDALTQFATDAPTLRERRRATASGIASVPTDDQPERTTRPSTPWTNEPESSVENSLASSTASSIATPEGTSSL